MPTYSYKCGECDHGFEHFQSMSSKLLTICPECGAKKLVRLIGSGAGILFKGDGWPGQDIARKGEKHEKN